jgi:hypothetical protein
MSYCPACGNQVDGGADARFCARCGRELPDSHGFAGSDVLSSGADRHEPPQGPPPSPVAAPTVHIPAPAGPPILLPAVPPPAEPVPFAQTALARFLWRVFVGRWEWAAAVAAAPVLAVTAVAVVAGAWSGTATHGTGVGFGTRTRAALALLVQGLGGSLSVTTPYSYDDMGLYYSYYDDGTISGSDSFPSDPGTVVGTAGRSTTQTYSFVPIAATVLWIGVLVLALYVLRKRLSGPEAAVRVALLGAAGALALALVGRPVLGTTHFDSGPVPVTLWTFAITLATALLVLGADGLRARIAARPAVAAAVRALRTAVLALLLTVTAAGIVVFVIAVAHYDSLSGWGVAAAGVMVLNAGVAGLNLGWGGPFQLSEGSQGAVYHVNFGLTDLEDVWGPGAVAGAVAGGVLCALLIGFLAVRLSRDRLEQFAVAGLFTVLFTLLAAVGGVSTDGSTLYDAVSGAAPGHSEVTTSVAKALLFGLLWSFGGVLVAPHVWRGFGGRGMPEEAFVYGWGVGAVPVVGSSAGSSAEPSAGPSARPGVGSGSVPPQPSAPPRAPSEPVVHDLGVVQPPRLNKPGEPPDRR